MYRIPWNLGGRIPEKTGMNELAKRACKENITAYNLQFDKLMLLQITGNYSQRQLFPQ